MLKLKTNKTFIVPSGRGVIEVVVRLIVENITFDKNNAKVNGHYYFIDVNKQAIKLDYFGANSLVQKETLEYLEENVLIQFQSTKSTYSNLTQRVKELTLMQIEQESPINYGTSAIDWVDDIDDIKTE